MGSRYVKHDKVARGQVGKTTKAARKALERGRKPRPVKVVTMAKKLKVTSRTPRHLR